MNEILFLLFAFFTVFLSIRLSYYVDYLSKNSKISGAFLAGVVLAGVTSLPEFVTCFSAIFVNNYSLALGDVLGSNIFNIFMICFFDLVFIKKLMFFKTNKSHNLVFLLLIVNYIVLYLFSYKLSFLYIGVPTFVIIITYVFYLLIISRRSTDLVKINDSTCEHIFLKFIVTAVFMIFSSIILTLIVNNLAILHPYFSNSFLGAIFLGITTSLPEVVTCYSLININSYDLALDDIVGSNFFNLLILSFGDLFIKKNTIYSFDDKGVCILIVLGFIFTLLCFVSNNLRNQFFKNKIYGIFSLLIVIIYLGYWIINFLG